MCTTKLSPTAATGSPVASISIPELSIATCPCGSHSSPKMAAGSAAMVRWPSIRSVDISPSCHRRPVRCPGPSARARRHGFRATRPRIAVGGHGGSAPDIVSVTEQSSPARRERGGRGALPQWRRRVSIGEALAEARRQAGLTVTEVSQRTRVRAAIITGIEADDYSACGGDFYVRGHIRSIARAVGADPEPLILEYDAARLGPHAIGEDITEPVTPIRVRERRGLNWTAVLGLALAVGLGFLAYHLLSGSSQATGAAAAARAHPATHHPASHAGPPPSPAPSPSATPSPSPTPTAVPARALRPASAAAFGP